MKHAHIQLPTDPATSHEADANAQALVRAQIRANRAFLTALTVARENRHTTRPAVALFHQNTPRRRSLFH